MRSTTLTQTKRRTLATRPTKKVSNTAYRRKRNVSCTPLSKVGAALLLLLVILVAAWFFSLAVLYTHMDDHSTTSHAPKRHHHHHNNKMHLRAAVNARNNPNTRAYELKPHFETLFDPRNLTRVQAVIEQLRQETPLGVAWPRLDPKLLDCPEIPPLSDNYPQTWPLLDLLHDWNPNDMAPPSAVDPNNNNNVSYLPHHSLCVLDWNIHSLQQIQAYRQAEIPFVLRHHPDVMRTAERWNSHLAIESSLSNEEEPYLVQMLQDEAPQRNEFAARSNHLAFWRGPNDLKDAAPTQNIKLGIRTWWQHAQELDQAVQDALKDSNQHNNVSHLIATSDHYYFRLSGTEQQHSYLYQELPVFHHDDNNQNDKDDNNLLFLPEPDEARGINCRLGMVGSVADNHFDPTRNWILNLKGYRRYILSPPEQCEQLDLQPLSHPSARHSRGYWSALTDEQKQALRLAQSTQVVLQPSDALYLPASWFHAIVSLTTSFQCNARSGTTHTVGSPLDEIFTKCGFPVALQK